ncbi:MAG: C-GCAxxG-C-C family protein [Eubacteriales bacterium]
METKNANREKIYQDAMEIMAKGYSCAESVVGAVYRNLETGLPEKVVGIASGFGGGIGGSGNTCGALTGGVMAIGMVLGSDDLENVNNKKARTLANEFISWFAEENNKKSTMCSVILEDFEKGTPIQFTYCQQLTAQSAVKAVELIMREQV